MFFREDSGTQWPLQSLHLRVFVVLLSAVVVVRGCMYQPDESVQCETIQSPLCPSLPGLHFNSTSFPNMYRHTNQALAEDFLDTTQLLDLESLNCSSYTRILICAAVYPVCYEGLFERVRPCKEMCVAVRESCEDIWFNRYERVWPRELECDQFEMYGTELCIWNDTSCEPSRSISSSSSSSENPMQGTEVPPAGTGSVTVCAGHLSPSNDTRASFGGLPKCVEPCDGVYFEKDNKMLLTLWTAVISFLCVIIAVLVFFTLLLNYRTIYSLETSVFYLVMSYGFLGFTNLISVAVGKESIACDSRTLNAYNQSVLIVDGTSSPVCTTFFSMSYYFTLCTWSWWVVLALEWGLGTITQRKTATRWKVVFHTLAWGVPFLFLVLALLIGAVSGNPITQTCSIDKQHKMAFIQVPLSLAILVCSVLIVVVFARITVLQNRKFKLMHDGPLPPKSPDFVDPSLLVRIGTYITFYLLPMFVVFCTSFYDYWFAAPWEFKYLTCSLTSASLQSCEAVVEDAKPSIKVYLVRLFASTCMGYVSVFWLLRKRLLIAWKNLFYSPCRYFANRNYDVNSGRPQHQQQPAQLVRAAHSQVQSTAVNLEEE